MKKKRLNIIVPEKLRPYLAKFKHDADLAFVIIGLLRIKPDPAYSYLLKTYESKRSRSNGNKRKSSIYKVRKIINTLINDDMLTIVTPYSRTEKKPPVYQFTDKYFKLEKNSVKAYKSYSDLVNYKNYIFLKVSKVREIRDNRVGNFKEYIDDWLALLAKNDDTFRFIEGLKFLQTQVYMFNHRKAVSLLHNGYKNNNLQNIPFGPFRIFYRPIRTGRLQTVPHLYFHTEYRKLILPYDDIKLQYGCLFCYDFSSQEIRIAASILPDSELNKLCQKDDSIWDSLIELSSGLPCFYAPSKEDVKKLIKPFALKVLYSGTSRRDLIKKIFKMRNKFNLYFIDMKTIQKNIRTFRQRIKEFYGPLDKVKSRMRKQYDKNDSFILPGGIKFNPNTKNKHGLTRTLFNNYIQSTGSLIMRTIIAESVNLRYSRLHFPVHDGCIFYAHDKTKLNEAKEEAKNLMVSSAQKWVHGVKTPVSFEWEIINR